MKTCFIVGNGTSRKNFDLNLIAATKYPMFGCNALWRDMPLDYIVAVDDGMIKEIQQARDTEQHFNLLKTIAIFARGSTKAEPYPLHEKPIRPSNNAGMFAIMEACKLGFTRLICIGLDFLIFNEEQSITNIYDGSANYGPETRCSLADSRNRLPYLAWVLKENPDVKFEFLFPRDVIVMAPQSPNASITTLENLENDCLFLIKEEQKGNLH